MILPLNGKGESTPLLTTAFDERNAAISPDARWLAYESNESGQDQIYVRPFPNVSDAQYQISTSGGRAPVWARNGRELFFVSGTTLWSASIELAPSFRVRAAEKLFDAPSLLFDTRLAGFSTVRSYDVARDGRFLVIKQSTGTDDRTAPVSIIVVQNWTEELKQRVPTP